MPQPLAGVRILDLSRLLPGPMCSWYLMGLGAEVVRVEHPSHPDYMRFVPPTDASGTGAWFHAVNAGKRSVALNLKQPVDREHLLGMLPGFDVLLESFRPGVMARLGLEPSMLRERFPRLIIASITGFGQDGPMRTAPGHDLGYRALAGSLSVGPRDADGLPGMPGLQVADIAGGSMTGAMAIAAALYGREKTGEGDWLDISMTESVMALASLEIAATATGGERPEPGQTPLTGGSSFYRLYRCLDGGVVAFAALEPKFQQALCVAVGEAVEMTEPALTALFATRTRDAWAALLEGACVNPMLELDELADHPQHVHRRSLVGEGATLRVRPPFAGCEDLMTRPAPQPDDHTREELARAGLLDDQEPS
ncbi:MAG: alpha-methylacyl-CoA racemase [Myxococcota bacterium]|jgi:alpha-methylacyl-CoA racemase